MYQKTFTAYFNDLQEELFCILLASIHTFSQAKPNIYCKPALLLQTLVQTAMQKNFYPIFYLLISYFFYPTFSSLIPCNKRNR